MFSGLGFWRVGVLWCWVFRAFSEFRGWRFRVWGLRVLGFGVWESRGLRVRVPEGEGFRGVWVIGVVVWV